MHALIPLLALLALQPESSGPLHLKMATTAGDIYLQLDPDKAPITVANFLRYADRAEYNNTIFHRTIPTFVVQGGGYSPDLKERPSDPPIRNEWQNGLKNIRGTIAMAREADPDTATRQFYFNVADNVRLDTARETTGNAGYAVFGHVILGMDVIDAIKVGETGTRVLDEEMKDFPVHPVVVTNVTRITAPEAAAAVAKVAVPEIQPGPVVANALGGTSAAAILAAARVGSARLVDGRPPAPGRDLAPEEIGRLKKAVLSDGSYLWEDAKACSFHPDVELVFEDASGAPVQTLILCYSCSEWRFASAAGTRFTEDFDPVRPELVRLVKSLFPKDEWAAALKE